MSQRQKKQKISHPSDQHAVAGSSNVESQPPIFALNIDCLDEMFEYLSLSEIYSFGQTCKRMNKAAGEYFKRNYSGDIKHCQRTGMYTYYCDRNSIISLLTIDVSEFKQFMPRISIARNDFSQFQYIQYYINEFESTKHIRLSILTICNERIDLIKKLLPQLEILDIDSCKIAGDFYETTLKYCENLKQIIVRSSRVTDFGSTTRDNNWLAREYPKLEHLIWMPHASHRIMEFHEFFQRNSNIQKFSTNAKFLCANADIVLNSMIQLEILEIKINVNFNARRRYTRLMLNETILNINRLHEHGFYKRLHIVTNCQCEIIGPLLTSFKGLESFHIMYYSKTCNLPQLENVKELTVDKSYATKKDMEIWANSMVNIERLRILCCGDIDIIMPFIHRSSKLKSIKLTNRGSLGNRVFNLTMLNSERAKFRGATKITIYVRDYFYLDTKWATPNGDTRLKHIEVRRDNSMLWEYQCFDFFNS